MLVKNAMNPAKRLLAMSPALLLAGCLSFGEDPPPTLLTLTASSAAVAGSGATSEAGPTIALVEFGAPQRLNVIRVPVQVSDSEVAYLKDAVWVEKPARLFRRLIAETIRAGGDRLVIDGDEPGVGAAILLRGDVREFGYDSLTSSVVVRFDAIKSGPGEEVESRRFEAEVSGVPAEAGEVGAALNDAANEVAGQVAEWVG